MANIPTNILCYNCNKPMVISAIFHDEIICLELNCMFNYASFKRDPFNSRMPKIRFENESRLNIIYYNFKYNKSVIEADKIENNTVLKKLKRINIPTFIAPEIVNGVLNMQDLYSKLETLILFA